MRYFVNRYYTEQDCSIGAEWFLRRRDACEAFAVSLAAGTTDAPSLGLALRAEPIDINLTAIGVLGALNEYASHPDNG